MSAASKLLEQLAEEGVALGRSAMRWLENRFAVEDTPENVARARRALSRVEPNVPPRPQARDFAVPARSPAPEGARRTAQRRTTERPLAARPQRPLAARPEQAAEQPPALPPPAEPLPEWAAKPRGGQWVTESSTFGSMSPEDQLRNSVYLTERWNTGNPTADALREWWDRAVPRYLRNDFGTPTDPLRELAPQAGMVDTPEAWSALAQRAIFAQPIGDITIPNSAAGRAGGLPSAGGSEVKGQLRRDMPWLNRQPVTDNLYSIDLSALGGGGGLTHISDELRNAMRPEISGIPADLAVRPESLQRMSFPQAVERVGRINQWRAAQQAEASLAAQNNPALRVYREYAENNPRGLRWVEIAAPEMTDLPEGYEVVETSTRRAGSSDEGTPFYRVYAPDGESIAGQGYNRDVAISGALEYAGRDPLQQALRYEGDTMGHCVGGYCDDVLSGRSRIFSLRDARGEPHVTIEASPRSQVFSDLVAHLGGDEAAAEDYLAQGFQARDAGVDNRSPLAHALELAGVPPTQDIIQIKGKGNRAPVDEYLPFVQDFVRQGQWGNVGDLGNTGLVRLPDGRYITQQQAEEAIAAIPETTVLMRAYGSREMVPTRRVYDPTGLGRLDPEEWQQIAPHFEGYAIGGRVDPDRCFCRHPLSAKR